MFHHDSPVKITEGRMEERETITADGSREMLLDWLKKNKQNGLLTTKDEG